MLSADQTKILAIVVLVVLGLAFAAWLAWVRRRLNYTWTQLPLYMLNLAMARVLWRAKVEGRVRIAKGQGAVIVCNHLGPIDPSFVALACDRQVHWMVAKEFVESPPFGWFLQVLQVIPVGRAGVDIAATKLAIRYAQQGELVGLFPEGRINKTGRLMRPMRPGAAHIALKARVPVIPCYLTGSPEDTGPIRFLFTPARAHLRVGEPIDLSEYYEQSSNKEVQAMLTKRFMVEMAKLAGVEDYVPELAGKRWKPGMDEEPLNDSSLATLRA